MAKISKDPKAKASLTTISEDSLLKHPILRALACILTEFNEDIIREVYDRLGYYLADRIQETKYLLDKKILIESNRDYYSYYTRVKFFCISPEYLYKIFERMDNTEFANALDFSLSLAQTNIKAYDVKNDVRTSFAKAIYKCLHSSTDLSSYLKHCTPIIRTGEEEWSSYYCKLMFSIIQTPKMHPLINSCTKTQAGRFVKLFIDYASDLNTIFSYSLSRSVFFDDNDNIRPNMECTYTILFVLITELLVNGHIDDLISKYSGTDDKSINNDTSILVDYLKGVKALHQGDPYPMHNATLNLIKEDGADVLIEPLIGFFAMCAVVMSKDKGIIATYAKLLKSLDKENALVSRGVIDWLTKKNIGPTLTKRITESRYRPATGLLFSFFAKYFNIGDVNPTLKYDVIRYTEIALKGAFKYIRLLYYGIDDNYHTAMTKLEEEIAMKPLFVVEHQEPWEKALDKIGRMLNMSTAGKSAASPASSSRVAYLISKNSIQPILQKSANGVSWSKGRNIALKSFKAGTTEGMTEMDLKLTPCVKVYAGWGGDIYSIDYRNGIYALAGNPNLFTDDASRLKVEITLIQPQLSVTTSKNGEYSLKTNIDLSLVDDSGIYIDSKNPLSITVMKLTDAQRRLIEALNSTQKLPKEAKNKLSDTLTAISSQMTVMSDVVSAKDTDVKRIKGWSKIIAQLIPDEEMIDVSLYVKPLKDTPPYLTPAVGAEYVNGNFKGKPVQARRNIKEEKKNLQTVHTLLKGFDNSLTGENSWQLDIESTLSLLASIAENSDVACVEWPEGAKMTVNRPTINASALSVNVRNANNWFEIEGDLKIDDKTMLSMAELLKRLRESKGRFIRLEGNDYLALSEHLANTLRSISRIADVNGKNTGMSAMNVDFIEELEKSGVDFKADESYRNLIARIGEADSVKIKTPKGIQADLRDYQKEGYRWLQRLSMWGAGACLADDMGLGKTLQTICLLYANRQKGASLVVAPTSLLLNWRDEITRFAPTMNVAVLNDFNDSEKRSSIIKEAKEGDIVISSYGLLVNLQEDLAARQWNVITLDEAHTIKNRDTKMSQSAMTLKGDMRVALTGTPLQNRLAEIWNIFQFINPGLLGSFQAFTDRFIIPIERDADRSRQRLLKRMLSPFMLRRTKSDVLSELPEKTEITVRVELSEEERAFYEHMRQEAEIAVSEGENSAITALAEITRLRQAACNVRLLQPSLKIESSKLRSFMEIVDSLHDNHHRALVFSQFTSHLALVKEQLDKAKVDYLYLDGSTPAAERARLVEQFQNTDIPLFLISLKAGGLGLNLTAADYVVHLDPWWNPAIEDQASDRSHRIGQQKPVTVYRLIAANTIEEKILRLHSQKKSLADALLEGTDMSARLTRDEILALLQER